MKWMRRVSDKTTIPLVWVFVLIGVCGSMILVAVSASMSMGRLYQKVDDHEDALANTQKQLDKLTSLMAESREELSEIKTIIRGIRNDGKKRLRLTPSPEQYGQGVSWCQGGYCEPWTYGREFSEGGRWESERGAVVRGIRRVLRERSRETIQGQGFSVPF